MAILALDIGEKKIGVAISQSGIISQEFSTIHYNNMDTAFGEVLFLIKRKKADLVVVGLPGNDLKSNYKITDFAKAISKHVRVIYQDETLSSKEAERVLFNLGLDLDKMRERRDQMAAKIILDQYLSHK